jgi:hypothetical protein
LRWDLASPFLLPPSCRLITMTDEAPIAPPVPVPEPAPMPTGDAFIESYFSEDLVSSETRADNGPTETAAIDPTGVERR